ncbi:MAG: RluA family pseudouridine synthase [Rickettsiales bacterium]|jgi:23S rRNA pseudouridine955/2504/2580 synthase|nr:RluA family pseudouridine synthase [Rickettsiales bacterium]
MISITINAAQNGIVIVRFLQTEYPNSNVTDIWKFIRKKDLRVNGKRVEPNYRLKTQDKITFSKFVAAVLQSPVRQGKNSENGTRGNPGLAASEYWEMLDSHARLIVDSVIYEDDEMMVLDKPYGLAVQGGTGIKISIDKILKNICPSGKQLKLVHRLDRYTTGVLIVAKNVRTAEELIKIFRERKNVTKEYLLLARGFMARASGSIDYPLIKKYENNSEKVYVDRLGGQRALTNYARLAYSPDYDVSFVRAEIITGRTHQIRVHFREIGNPLLGDFKYGGIDAGKITGKLQLHSHRTTLNLFQKKHTFIARIPKHMEKILNRAFADWDKII